MTRDSDITDQLNVYLGVQLDRTDPAVLEHLLRENHWAYRGAGANKVSRAKGFVMASFADTGLPEEAVPFILEELQSARYPYLIAAAARALRGSAEPRSRWVPFLFKALENLSHGDDAFCFERLDPADQGGVPTSGYREIFETLAWSGPAAVPFLHRLKMLPQNNSYFLNSGVIKLLNKTIRRIEAASEDGAACCQDEPSEEGFTQYRRRALGRKAARAIMLEDHAARQVSFGGFFKGKPAVIAFFYTRCDNPNKCSMTITKLGLLQRQLREQGLGAEVKIAAITYDPAYDLPQRIGDFCRNRQMVLDGDCCGFRINEGSQTLRDYLDLGVNYTGDFVNKHTVELYLLDRYGRARVAMTRLQWDHAQVIAELQGLVAEKPLQTLKGIAQHIYSMLPTAAVAFFPKCPLCLMAYLSAFGISGVNVFRLSPWLMPSIILLFGVHIFVIARRCLLRRWFIPLYFSVAGIATLMAGQFFWHQTPIVTVGAVLILCGAALNSTAFKFTPAVRVYG